MPLAPEALESAARRVVGRLKTARERAADRPADELRRELEQELRAALTGLSPDDMDRATAAARELVVGEARSRLAAAAQPADPELEDRARALAERVKAMESDRARLAEENARLQAELADARVRAAKPSAGSLANARRALRALAQQQDKPFEGVTSEERAFVAALAPLLQFASEVTMASKHLMADFSLGAAAKMNSLQIQTVAREIPTRFSEAIEGDASAARALDASLTSCREELTQLNDAFTTCIPRGARKLLMELEPGRVAGDRKGVLGGVDERQAWNAFVRLWGDLKEMGPTEVWDRYFQPALRDHLSHRAPTPPPPPSARPGSGPMSRPVRPLGRRT